MRLERRCLAAAVVVVAAAVLPMFLTAGLAPQLRADLALGELGLGVAVAGFHATSALSAPWFGRWLRALGPARGLQIVAGLVALCSLAIAFAAHSAALLIVLLGLTGLANGASGPGASALLSATVSSRRRGLAFGAQQAGAPLAALAAGLGTFLAAGQLGWRWAFALAALVALIAAAVVPRGAAVVPTHREGPARGRDPATDRSLRLLTAAACLASATSTGVMAFLVTFAVDSGLSEGDAALLLGAVSGLAVVSRVGLGLAVDRWGGDALAVAAALLIAGAAGCVALIAATPPLIVAGALGVGGLGWGWTGLLTLAVVERHAQEPGRAVGVLMSGLFTGAIAGPILVGTVAQDGAYAPAWIACAVLALLSALAVRAARAEANVPASSGHLALVGGTTERAPSSP